MASAVTEALATTRRIPIHRASTQPSFHSVAGAFGAPERAMGVAGRAARPAPASSVRVAWWGAVSVGGGRMVAAEGAADEEKAPLPPSPPPPPALLTYARLEVAFDEGSKKGRAEFDEWSRQQRAGVAGAPSRGAPSVGAPQVGSSTKPAHAAMATQREAQRWMKAAGASPASAVTTAPSGRHGAESSRGGGGEGGEGGGGERVHSGQPPQLACHSHLTCHGCDCQVEHQGLQSRMGTEVEGGEGGGGEGDGGGGERVGDWRGGGVGDGGGGERVGDWRGEGGGGEGDGGGGERVGGWRGEGGGGEGLGDGVGLGDGDGDVGGRTPQSWQSVPYSQMSNCEPSPPSSQSLS